MLSSSFTFRPPDQAPASNQHQSHENVLCGLCARVAQNSRIIHQAPKINWTGSGGEFDEAEASQAGHPKVEVFEHHQTLGALKRSASTCHLCALLCAHDSEYPELSRDSSNSKTYVLKVIRADAHLEGPGLLKVQIRGVQRSGATYLMDGAPQFKMGGTLSRPRTDHPDVLNLAKKWLETCLRDHVSCQNRNHPTDGWAPTRLLKVTGFRTSVFSMKLCLGSDLKAGTRYLTLSHCWGGRDIVKLTENMLSSFKQDIPLSLLPQNFKDAAALTLFLGYEYLWIDSLCIVQDSPADWAREAAVMGDIYRYSLCTIAALGAADPHGGCFLERSALSFVPCQLFLDPQTQRGVYAENWRNPSPNSSQASSRARLLTRGWVLQESALSPRTLYFGSDMLYYSCTSTHISEAERTQSSSSYRPNIKQRFYDLLDKVEKGEDYYSWAPFWWNIIRDYTACDLTVLSDKWPAISGLAAVVQSKSDTRLVHGLWEKHLVSEIMWRASAPRNNRRINEEMPSWSWIGINEPVSKMGYNMKGYFRFDAGVSLQASPPDDKKLFARGRMSRIKTGIRYHGDGRREYWFKFLTPEPTEADSWSGFWSPDVRPDTSWETWIMRVIVDDRVKEAPALF